MKKSILYLLVCFLIIPAGVQIGNFLIWIGLVNTICIILFFNIAFCIYLYIAITVLRDDAERHKQMHNAEFNYLSDKLKNKK